AHGLRPPLDPPRPDPRLHAGGPVRAVGVHPGKGGAMNTAGRRTATLLCLSSRQELSGGLVQESVDVAGKVPLEHAAHVPSAMALVDVRRDVVPGAFIVLGAVQDDAVESS